MAIDTPLPATEAPTDRATSLAGRRFVLSGVSRLAIRVGEELATRGGGVALVGDDPDGLASGIDPSIARIPSGDDHAEALVRAGLAGADCLLLLADNDLENLRTAVACRAVAPTVPVVLRAFDATLADQLERGLNVRRAFSVSSLAAPSFVAAALGSDVLETMRLGDIELPIARLELGPASPLVGLTASEVKQGAGCALLGHAEAGQPWQAATGDSHRLQVGDRVVVAGRLIDVLALARDNSALPKPTRRGAMISRLKDLLAGWRRARSAPRSSVQRASTLLPLAALAMAALLLATMVVFAIVLHLDPIEALYQAVLTAFGSPSISQSAAWLKVFAVAAVIAGGALVGILFGYVAAYATTERLEHQMGRRAHHLRNHVVLAGLGNVGYRVERLLFDLGIPSVIVERTPDPRYLSAVGERTPVLAGDARLPENLERAGIGAAFCFLACTDDDLGNVEACIQARKLLPSIRTVARVFDPVLAERMTDAFGVDVAISTTRVAARAFVGAAADERSLRPFRVDGLEYVAMRYGPGRQVTAEDIERWRTAGIRILAVQHGDGPTLPASAISGGLGADDRVVVAGPAESFASLVLTAPDVSGRTG